MSTDSQSCDLLSEVSVSSSIGEDESQSYAAQAKSYRHRTQAWWHVGEYLEIGGGNSASGITHQSAKYSLTGNRVFANQKDELWDLTDSLLELYEAKQEEYEHVTLQLNKKSNRNTAVEASEWLQADPSHGFIRVFAPNTDYNTSQLMPCTLSTSAHKLCIQLGISLNSLHIQMGGDIIRRLDPYEHPLVLQNDYLSGLGYDNTERIQQEGISEDLGFLIRFYAGKPFHDSTFSRNQLVAWLDIRKGKVIQQWSQKLCILSGTRLLIYKNKQRKGKPLIIQLAKGSVEACKVKGHDLCLKLTSTLQGERCIYLSFCDVSEYNRWFKKCKKATDKLPTHADLSACHLEFLPETIFINDQLQMLNLRHNVIRERPLEEDSYTIGWIDDLPRFTKLRSLNLASNNLLSFPVSLCQIPTLVELNLASNKLEEIPAQISQLKNLQALHLHNNHLHDLPEELLVLRKLFVLVLAFNRFLEIPDVVAHLTDVRVSEVENIIIAGNQIEDLHTELLASMKYVKKIDLRMNHLQLNADDMVHWSILEHLTHLDVRDNQLVELDLRCIKTLEYMNCERNRITSLQLNGLALKNLFAAHNEIDHLVVSPKPEWLLQVDVSHNKLRRLPEWISDCFFLQKLSAAHNVLNALPEKIFLESKKLKSLKINHNRLTTLPQDVDTLFLEELYIQHNHLAKLPSDLLKKANKLRLLNVSRNRLTSLPSLNDSRDLNKVQELYLSANCLTSTAMSIISGYARLKVLHLADNEITEIADRDLEPLELLQELNVSGNQLCTLPSCVGRMSKLVILRAHSNHLDSLPDFKKATSLKVLDVGHNQLLDVSVTSLMDSQINLLDMSLNTQLRVDPLEFRSVKNKKTVCLVDLTGQDRILPGLEHRSILQNVDDMDPSIAWKVGFSETSGVRNKLCISTLKVLKFGNDNAALFAMFDGGHNNEVPKILVERMPGILKEELSKHNHHKDYMKYALLSAHSKLRRSGQKLGASCVVCHVERCIDSNNVNNYTLQIGNVGDVEIVLCRAGQATLLTQRFTTDDTNEIERVTQLGAIITEDNKLSGTTKTSRMLGCAYLYPYVIPEPYTNTITLQQEDEFMIIGSRGLWHYVEYDEAVQHIYETGNPVVAAKRLQDLAQGYGSKENIAVLVIRFNTDSSPSLCKLRPRKRSMSIDDFEEASLYANKQKAMKNEVHKQRADDTVDSTDVREELDNAPLHHTPDVNGNREVLDSDLIPEDASESNMNVVSTSDSCSTSDSDNNHAASSSQNTLTKSSNTETNSNSTVTYSAQQSSSHSVERMLRSSSVQNVNDNKMPATDNTAKVDDTTTSDTRVPVERHLTSSHRTLSMSSTMLDSYSSQLDKKQLSDDQRTASLSSITSASGDGATLKPLPNQRYLKRDAASEWEEILQKRLTEQVKDKELQQVLDNSSQESLLYGAKKKMSIVEIDANIGGPSLVQPSAAKSTTAGSYIRSSQTHQADSLQNLRNKQPKVKSTIAMFENMSSPNKSSHQPPPFKQLPLKEYSGSPQAALSHSIEIARF